MLCSDSIRVEEIYDDDDILLLVPAKNWSFKMIQHNYEIFKWCHPQILKVLLRKILKIWVIPS